jgi:hypothetical protein
MTEAGDGDRTRTKSLEGATLADGLDRFCTGTRFRSAFR